MLTEAACESIGWEAPLVLLVARLVLEGLPDGCSSSAVLASSSELGWGNMMAEGEFG